MNALKAWYSQCGFYYITCRKHRLWDINDGLCTLEEHRNLPIEVQAKHLWATGLIDDVIIGNAYASEEELEKLGNLNRYMLQLKVHFVDEATEVEKRATQRKNYM